MPQTSRGNRLFSGTLTLLLLFLSVTAARAAYPVHEEVLENGLKILVLENRKAPTATFQIWYRVGGVDDPLGRSGISHLLEHMMFKGTEKFGPKTFSQTIKRAGGVDNAFTSKDYTGYFQLMSADRLPIAMELEADRMSNLLLPEQEVMSERDVVKEERRLRYEDDPQSLVYEEVMAAAFKTHPYHRPVIGWMSDLNSIVPSDLVEHYHRFYTPNNAVVMVVGDVDTAETVERIRSWFGHIRPGPPLRRSDLEEGPQYGERRVMVHKEAQLPYVMIVFKTPALPHRDAYALDVLASILSEGRTSRLYKALVHEQKLALSAWAAYDGLANGPGLLYLGGTAALGKSGENLEQALLAEAERIKQTPPTEREIQKAKNQVEAGFIMEQDSIYMQARTIGGFEMAGGWRQIDDYVNGIRAVTAEDVSRVAREYLMDDRKTTGILIPETSPGGTL